VKTLSAIFAMIEIVVIDLVWESPTPAFRLIEYHPYILAMTRYLPFPQFAKNRVNPSNI
jgi:hypothetical protein